MSYGKHSVVKKAVFKVTSSYDDKNKKHSKIIVLQHMYMYVEASCGISNCLLSYVPDYLMLIH